MTPSAREELCHTITLSCLHCTWHKPSVWGWQQCWCRAPHSAPAWGHGAWLCSKAALHMWPAPPVGLTTNTWSIPPILPRAAVPPGLCLLQSRGTGELPWTFIAREDGWDLMNQNTEFRIHQLTTYKHDNDILFLLRSLEEHLFPFFNMCVLDFVFFCFCLPNFSSNLMGGCRNPWKTTCSRKKWSALLADQTENTQLHLHPWWSPTGQNTPVSFMCLTTASATGWHQPYSKQSVTHLNYMPKVAQMLQDFLYQNLSLKDTVGYNEPVQESPVQTPAVEPFPSLSSEVASLLTVTQYPCDHAVTQISETF